MCTVQLEQWLQVLLGAQDALYRYKGILAVKDEEKGDFLLILQVGCSCYLHTKGQLSWAYMMMTYSSLL